MYFVCFIYLFTYLFIYLFIYFIFIYLFSYLVTVVLFSCYCLLFVCLLLLLKMTTMMMMTMTMMMLLSLFYIYGSWMTWFFLIRVIRISIFGLQRHGENVPSDVYASKGSNHSYSLIRVFFVRMMKLCILGYPKCDQCRFWSVCANAQANQNLRWAHMRNGTFFDVPAHWIDVFWLYSFFDLFLTFSFFHYFHGRFFLTISTL